MLRGYNCTEVIKNEKGVNEARNKTKTGGNEGMKKERKKVLLVWVMTLAMVFGVLQPAAVSYTHLDVYKRQALRKLGPTPIHRRTFIKNFV